MTNPSLLMTAEMKATFNSNPMSTSNEKNGNGQQQPLKRSKKSAKKKKEFSYLNKKCERRMRFSNAKDPIYVVFDYFENKSVVDLAMDFVKDSLFEIKSFVSTIVK